MNVRNPPDYSAWLRPQAWPYNAPGYVYMMRAAEQIGATLLPSDWKGINNSVGRHQVLAAIREHCAYGRLTAAAMVFDGKFKELPAHRWNNFDCWKWFPKCTITNFEVIEHAHPLAGLSHFPLYLTEQSLRRLLPQQPEAEPEVVTSSGLKPTREQLEQLFYDIVQYWRDKGSIDEYRVTREDFEALALMCWPGATSTRDVFDRERPEKWAKPGKFPRKETDINKIAERYGIPQNYA